MIKLDFLGKQVNKMILLGLGSNLNSSFVLTTTPLGNFSMISFVLGCMPINEWESGILIYNASRREHRARGGQVL